MRFAALLLLITISACDTVDHPTWHGRLYFVTGNYLGEFDLRDGTSEAVENFGDVTIDHISAYEDDDFLMTMRVYYNGRETSRIMRYDLRKNEMLTLIPGLMAEHMSAENAIIYDDGSNLFAAHRAKAYRDELLIDFHGFNSQPSVVVLSDNEILFSGTRDGEALIQHYDVGSNKTTPMELLSATCVLSNAVWIRSTDQLLCKLANDSTQSLTYVLSSLDGVVGETLSLPADKSLFALVHIPDQDLVVFTERSNLWGGGQPTNPVWVYDLQANKIYRISSDQYLGSSVVYRP